MKRIFAMAIALLVLAGCGQTGPGFPFPAAEYAAFCPAGGIYELPDFVSDRRIPVAHTGRKR